MSLYAIPMMLILGAGVAASILSAGYLSWWMVDAYVEEQR